VIVDHEDADYRAPRRVRTDFHLLSSSYPAPRTGNNNIVSIVNYAEVD
jgi:hypothetical protein